jgi:hypothetical protein
MLFLLFLFAVLFNGSKLTWMCLKATVHFWRWVKIKRPETKSDTTGCRRKVQFNVFVYIMYGMHFRSCLWMVNRLFYNVRFEINHFAFCVCRCNVKGKCQPGGMSGPFCSPCSLWSFDICPGAFWLSNLVFNCTKENVGSVCSSNTKCNNCVEDPSCGWCEEKCECLRKGEPSLGPGWAIYSLFPVQVSLCSLSFWRLQDGLAPRRKWPTLSHQFEV